MLKSTRVILFELGLWVLVLDSSTKYLLSIILKVVYSYSKLVYLLQHCLQLCSTDFLVVWSAITVKQEAALTS